MSRSRKRSLILQQGRTPGSYTPWPHACATHVNYLTLSLAAKALLGHFLGEFRGFNNGDLSCAWKTMKARGWRSRTTVEKARDELERTGWIVRTRQGFRNRCNLYALTLFAINDTKGKADVAETRAPLGFWKDARNPWLDESRSERPPPRSFSKARRGATPDETSPADGQVNKIEASNDEPTA
jgi:hypothetical protein